VDASPELEYIVLRASTMGVFDCSKHRFLFSVDQKSVDWLAVSHEKTALHEL
jgi:hypothetical protein